MPGPISRAPCTASSPFPRSASAGVFNGSAHFSRAFRNEYGISPREYRYANGRGLEGG